MLKSVTNKIAIVTLLFCAIYFIEEKMTKAEYEKRFDEIENYLVFLEEQNASYVNELEKIKEVNNYIINNVEGINAKIELLDNSVDPDQKRKQKVLEVRDAILSHLHGGYSAPACGKLNPWNVYQIAGWFVDYTERYGVDINLALAVGRQESAFCQKAVSPAGAVGVMQLMNETANDLSRRINLNLDRYDTEGNIRMGIYYLGQLLLDFNGNMELSVKSYNMGPTNVRKVLTGELSNYYSETIDYWNKVNQYYDDFKRKGL